MLEFPRWKYVLVALVMLIAALLALPNVFGEDPALQVERKDRAPMDDLARQTIEDLLHKQQIVIKRDYLDNGRYPSSSEGLPALVQRPANAASWNGPYLKTGTVPADPWGRPYQYKCCPGDHGDYDIWTTGADGAPGGEGENADVTSWDVK